MKVRIYYHHTDCGGVVYYANYLKFLEEARTEFLEGRAASVKEMSRAGVLFVVARQEIDYKLPAFYGDILDIKTWVSETSAVKIIFEYDIKNQDSKLISQARTVLVCVGRNLKPQALPENIRSSIEKK